MAQENFPAFYFLTETLFLNESICVCFTLLCKLHSASGLGKLGSMAAEWGMQRAPGPALHRGPPDDIRAGIAALHLLRRCQWTQSPVLTRKLYTVGRHMV